MRDSRLSRTDSAPVTGLNTRLVLLMGSPNMDQEPEIKKYQTPAAYGDLRPVTTQTILVVILTTQNN
jgi:hypothetical protein